MRADDPECVRTAATSLADAAALPQSAKPMRRTLFQLSFPLFLQSFLTLAVMLVDTMIISAHSPGAAAAVAVAYQILIVAFELSTMLGIGGVIVISHHLGRGDEAQARQVAAVAVAANTLFGFAIGALLAALGPLILWLLNTPPDIASDARLYIYIVAAAMVFNGFAAAATPCLRGFGKSPIILALGLIASAFYLTAEYVLILGWGPIPALGVLGSALGTLSVRIVAAVMFGFVLARSLGISLDMLAPIKQWPLVRHLFSLSFPSVSDYIAYGFYQIVLLGFAAGFGVAAVLSRAYAMIAMAFLILVIMAISQGNEVLLGYRRGGGDTHGAFHQALRSSFIATVTATSLAVLLYLISDSFIGLFTRDEAVLSLSKQLLLLTIAIQPGFAFNTILFQSLRAVGDVRWPVFVSQTVTWAFSLPLAWLFCIHFNLGVVGIWYALIIEETAKALIMTYRWCRQGWLRHEVS